MPTRRIHCFIAIRFGKDDTDAIFLKMAKVIEQMGLISRRVDKIEHIENINLKILSELNDADIAIADLTYASPSVYYEAGYAHRRVPVIYTCRKDHLHNTEDFLKLHFDVDRYNIIFWENPDDKDFEPKLKSRLQSVISKIVNPSMIGDLENFLRNMNKSLFNPENIIRRLNGLFSQIEVYPIVSRNDLQHDQNLEKRLIIYEEIFSMLDTEFEREKVPIQEEQWTRLAISLEDEIGQMRNRLEQSNYGETVMYVSHLYHYYKMYLNAMTKLHQRPSFKYGDKFHEVKTNIERLIQILQIPI